MNSNLPLYAFTLILIAGLLFSRQINAQKKPLSRPEINELIYKNDFRLDKLQLSGSDTIVLNQVLDSLKILKPSRRKILVKTSPPEFARTFDFQAQFENPDVSFMAELKAVGMTKSNLKALNDSKIYSWSDFLRSTSKGEKIGLSNAKTKKLKAAAMIKMAVGSSDKFQLLTQKLSVNRLEDLQNISAKQLISYGIDTTSAKQLSNKFNALSKLADIIEAYDAWKLKWIGETSDDYLLGPAAGTTSTNWRNSILAGMGNDPKCLECSDEESMYSPAAYLVYLLEFLERSFGSNLNSVQKANTKFFENFDKTIIPPGGEQYEDYLTHSNTTLVNVLNELYNQPWNGNEDNAKHFVYQKFNTLTDSRGKIASPNPEILITWYDNLVSEFGTTRKDLQLIASLNPPLQASYVEVRGFYVSTIPTLTYTDNQITWLKIVEVRDSLVKYISRKEKQDLVNEYISKIQDLLAIEFKRAFINIKADTINAGSQSIINALTSVTNFEEAMSEAKGSAANCVLKSEGCAANSPYVLRPIAPLRTLFRTYAEFYPGFTSGLTRNTFANSRYQTAYDSIKQVYLAVTGNITDASRMAYEWLYSEGEQHYIYRLSRAIFFKTFSEYSTQFNRELTSRIDKAFQTSLKRAETGLLEKLRENLIAMSCVKLLTANSTSYPIAAALTDSDPVGTEGNIRQLERFLYLDLRTHQGATTTRIAYLTTRIQTFLQFVQLGKETADLTDFNEATWFWLQNFGIWHASQLITTNPESFLIPELRPYKTFLYDSLINSITNSGININEAYEKYQSNLNDFAFGFEGGYAFNPGSNRVITIYAGPSTIFFSYNTFTQTFNYSVLKSNGAWIPWKPIPMSSVNQSKYDVLAIHYQPEGYLHFFVLEEANAALFHKSFRFVDNEIIFNPSSAESTTTTESGGNADEAMIWVDTGIRLKFDRYGGFGGQPQSFLANKNNTFIHFGWDGQIGFVFNGMSLTYATSLGANGELSFSATPWVSPNTPGYLPANIEKVISSFTHADMLAVTSDGLYYGGVKITGRNNLDPNFAGIGGMLTYEPYTDPAGNNGYYHVVYVYATSNDRKNIHVWRRGWTDFWQNPESGTYWPNVRDFELYKTYTIDPANLSDSFSLNDKFVAQGITIHNGELAYVFNNWQSPLAQTENEFIRPGSVYYNSGNSYRNERALFPSYGGHSAELANPFDQKNVRYHSYLKIYSSVDYGRIINDFSKVYYNELMFFSPVHLAEIQRSRGEFESAFKLLSISYDPMKQSEALRRVYPGFDIGHDFASFGIWAENPFNPFGFAEFNRFSYLMKCKFDHIENLIDWGDLLFSMDNAEAVTRAREIYQLAEAILESFNILESGPAACGNLVTSSLGNMMSSSSVDAFDDGAFLASIADSGFDGFVGLSTDLPELEIKPFCTPQNPRLTHFRLKIASQLDKIRSGRNMAGFKRDLQLYTPAANPEELVRLSAAGNLQQFQAFIPGTPPPIYRYSFLLDRAKYLTNLAQQFQGSMLSAIEKEDAEKYSLLQAKQEVKLEQANVSLSDLRIKEANASILLAEIQRQKSLTTENYYSDLIEQGLNHYEEASLLMMEISMYLPSSVSSSLSANPEVSVSYSPSGILQTLSSIYATRSSYERRRKEWQFQEKLAGLDIRAANANIAQANIHATIAEKEKAISDLRLQHANDNVEFLGNKFTGKALYSWMKNNLKQLYRQQMQLATSTAKAAQNALSFETQIPLDFIKFNYWDESKYGLLGSEQLLGDIEKLEQHRLNTMARKNEITKTISLSNANPISFANFKQSGILDFETPMDWFDDDYPGHYMRLIKSVEVSFVALVPSVEGIKATLFNNGLSRVIVGEPFDSPVLIQRSPESITLSKAQNANGLFTLEPSGELLFPFEGSGVATHWILEMPKGANKFNYASIADVLFTIKYTSLEDRDYRSIVLKNMGQDELGNITRSASRYFSVREHFPDQWYYLNNFVEGASVYCDPFNIDCVGQIPQAKNTLNLSISEYDFVPNEDGKRIEKVTVAVRLKDQQSTAHQSVPLSLKYFSGSQVRQTNLSASTRNQTTSNSFNGASAYGRWAIKITDNNFNPRDLADIFLVVQYKGTNNYNK